MEANAEHDFRLKRLIGMLRTKAKQVLRHNFFVQSAKQHCREDLLTPESYMVKKLSGKIAGQLLLCVTSYRGNMTLWAPKLLPEAVFSLFLSIYFKVIHVLPLEAVVRMHMFESFP